jgi:hypothetical protein
MKNTVVAAITVVIVLATSITVADEAPWYRDRKAPGTEAQCKVAGGEWSKTPFFQSSFCRIKYSDGGKQCRRATECQSLICVVEKPEQNLGQCHGEAERFATFWYLDEGGKPKKISVE